MSKRTVRIGTHNIGPDQPVFVIAEIGANHNQDFDTGRQLIDLAAESGCDAVKFQSFTVDKWISKDFQEFPTMPDVQNMRKELEAARLPYELYARFVEHCEERGLVCFSTPSHESDVDLLEELDVPAYKSGSVQVTDIPTIEKAARLGRPVILSGGASHMSEILQAVESVWDCGNRELLLMQCTSLYPTRDFNLVNLRVMQSFEAMFDFPVGLSDHTMDPTVVPVAATALGARIFEKHVTLDRSSPGPDHPFALEPDELKKMVTAIRRTEEALGNPYRRILDEEVETARLGRRSLVAARNLEAGHRLNREDLTIKRPGYGIQPEMLEQVLGAVLRRSVESDRVLAWSDLLENDE